MNEYEELRKANAKGFAHAYLDKCDKELKSDNDIDIEVYNKLAQLDSKLGTTASEQLTCCLNLTTRSDIIKVLIFAQNPNFKIIPDYRF